MALLEVSYMSNALRRTIPLRVVTPADKAVGDGYANPEGKKYKLKLKVTPTGAWYKNVSWFCSESKVASVSAKGLVKAKGKGKCKITCTITTVNGKKKKATCKVTVK